MLDPVAAVRHEALRVRRADPRGDPLAGRPPPGQEGRRRALSRRRRRTPARSANWGMNYVHAPLSPARLQTIPRGSWRDSGPVAGSHAAGRSVRSLVLGTTTPSFTLVALDTTDDGKTNYDAPPDQRRPEPAAARLGDWFSVEVRDAQGLTGAWCKVLRLSPDLSETEIYVGGFSRNSAYPEEFRRTWTNTSASGRAFPTRNSSAPTRRTRRPFSNRPTASRTF